MTQLLLVGLLVLVTTPVRASGPYYEDAGACPFECCTYRDWTTREPTTAYRHRDIKSSVAFRLKPGEPVTGLTGVVVTLKPGKAIVRRAIKLGNGEKQIEAKPGDVLSLLHYAGEGYFKFKLRGNIYVDEVPFPEKREKTFGVLGDRRAIKDYIRTETVPTTVWWVKVRNRQGNVGWSNEPSHFDHVDACE